MMFYWKRIAPGAYEAIRNGVLVATANRVKDHGEPLWELTILDGTQLRKSSKGNTFNTYCTLGDAKFAYGYAYRMTQEIAA